MYYAIKLYCFHYQCTSACHLTGFSYMSCSFFLFRCKVLWIVSVVSYRNTKISSMLSYRSFIWRTYCMYCLSKLHVCVAKSGHFDSFHTTFILLSSSLSLSNHRIWWSIANFHLGLSPVVYSQPFSFWDNPRIRFYPSSLLSFCHHDWVGIHYQR